MHQRCWSEREVGPTQTGDTDDTAEWASIARVRAGDADAYSELVYRHVAIARRTAVLFGAGSDADDVVQQAFVKAYRKLGEFDDGKAFRPWLLRIVVHETHNAVRASERRRAAVARAAFTDAVPGDEGTAEDPAELVLTTERRTELVAALRRLRAPHRRVVICRYLLDLDVDETATTLGWPPGTVKSRLHRALRRLRRELDVDKVNAPTPAETDSTHPRPTDADTANADVSGQRGGGTPARGGPDDR